MNSKDHYVIFSGANERAIVACCRYFMENNIPFSIIARPTKDKILLTTYKKNVARFRALDTLNAEDMLAQIVALRHSLPDKRLIFIPTADSVNRVILLHRAKFNAAGLTITLCDANLYSTLSDKSTFNALAQSFAITIPESLNTLCENKLPVVAKPMTEFSTINDKKLYPQLLFTPEHLAAFKQSYARENFFYQRYIDGQSFYLLLFMDKSETKVLWQRNILQQAEGKSIIAAEICACPDPHFESSAIKMLKSTGFSGFIMIEIMQEKGISYLIEANPRLWGPFQLAIDNGFNPQWLSLSGNYPDSRQRKCSYFWLNGLLLNKAEGKRIRRYSYQKNILMQVLRGEIYNRWDTVFLFLRESGMAFKYYLKKLN
ncbi:Predicted ATP-dependent carboligase, ATP-grasp superfamily [Kosakonia arachidis]|uniref:Predicted ATP-dependent carboligase, ATP-grasp superfamily n=1 Tax=Kosakonia arachidis TaxID=551989 RepID=A0A1I7E8Q2_9ENTR|nr:hypothetical protein [Kosakonia arachidis]SFU20317.1 Predicted ATP-dependent carboligase, ATP-grasp superfamily [Kosakonia arachidis]